MSNITARTRDGIKTVYIDGKPIRSFNDPREADRFMAANFAPPTPKRPRWKGGTFKRRAIFISVTSVG